MEQEIKENWIAALRNGKYQQGQGVLRSSANTFCCLGVLCDIIEPLWGDDPQIVSTAIGEKDTKMDAYSWKPKVFNVAVQLPTDLRTSLGMTFTVENNLIRLNDSGKPFAEIADYIEKNL